MGIYRINDNDDLYEVLGDHVLCWKEFEKALEIEDGLFGYELEVFKERLSKGHMQVVVDDQGLIIATVSIFRKFTDVIKARLYLDPEVELWEIGSSWTHKNYRGRGIHRKLREIQLSEISRSHLVISHTKGRGTSGASEDLNWSQLFYDLYPFVCSFAGWPIEGNKFQMSSGLIVPSRKLFLSKDHKPDTHEWEMYHHFWISDQYFADNLEKIIRSKFNDDIHSWRKFLLKELAILKLNPTPNQAPTPL